MERKKGAKKNSFMAPAEKRWKEFRQLLALGGGGPWEVVFRNGVGELVFAEDLCKIRGYEDNTIPRNFDEYVETICHPDDRECVRHEYGRLLKGEISETKIEYRIWYPAKESWNWICVIAAIAEVSDDRSTALMTGISFDIQEHMELKSRRDVIDAANERTRIMLDATPLACNFWDENFNNIDCNAEAVNLFDLSDKQECLDRFLELSPPYQRDGRPSSELVKERITEAFSKGRCRFEWMHQKLDGTPIPAEITLVRVQRDKGPIVVGYTRDLRELKTKEGELERERLLFKRILESSPICFLILVEGVVRFATPHARSVLGVDVGTPVTHFYVDTESRAEFFDDLHREKVVNWRVIPICAGDQAREMLTNAFMAEYDGEEGVMLWFLDVTEMRDHERELLLARDSAEESARAKSNFLANMSHEIRTPMNAILGMTRLVLDSDLSPRQRDYLEKSEASAKALLRILNDILDFSKIEAGRLEMEQVAFNIEEILSGVLNVVSDAANEKKLEILLSVDPSTPMSLIGDPLRLHQILVNLLSNAIKFTEEGEIAVLVGPVEDNGQNVMLRFAVQDTGIGMTPDQISRLFSAFSQGDASTTRRYGGTGLGLAISKRLVEIMGGTIGCRSSVGVGSEFHFTARFPRVSAERPFKVEKKTLKGLDVLVVDDNATSLEILSNLLSTMGCNVEGAQGGEDALKMLSDRADRQKPFDVVIIDWKMPRMDGIEASRLINDLLPIMPPVIIMATAYWSDEVIQKAEEIGIKSVLMKPVTPSALVGALADFFAVSHNGFDEDGMPIPDGVQPGHEERLVARWRGSRILLVEDNEINQLIAREILEQADFIVDIAANGLEALAMADEGNEYALVLMDIQMPEMDGLTAATELRKREKFKIVPIIAMTAHAMVGDREKSLEAGMNDHVTKPIDPGELFQTLAKNLAKAQDTSQNPQAGTVPPDQLPASIPGLAIDEGMRRVAGNAKLYRRLLITIRDDFPKKVKEICDLVATGGSVKDAEILAHSVKGAAGNMGAKDVQAAAEKLETAFRTEALDTVPELLAGFAEEVEKLTTALAVLE